MAESNVVDLPTRATKKARLDSSSDDVMGYVDNQVSEITGTFLSGAVRGAFAGGLITWFGAEAYEWFTEHDLSELEYNLPIVGGVLFGAAIGLLWIALGRANAWRQTVVDDMGAANEEHLDEFK